MITPRNFFENHVAKVILDNEDYFVLDWRKDNNTSDFYINYILDRKIVDAKNIKQIEIYK